MPVAEPLSRPSSPRWRRPVRFGSVIALALVLTLLGALAVIGYVPGVHGAFTQLFSFGGTVPAAAVGVTGFAALLLPVTALFVAERRGWLTWPVLAFAGLAVLPVLGWLAWDEPAIRHPITLEEFSPVFPGADRSFAVLMEYSKQTPGADARAFASVKLQATWRAVSSREPAPWIEFVTKNRAAIAADWAAIAPQRRWLDELAAFDRIGDLTPADPAANLILFQPWRTLAQRACGIATLQALDGHGDDALATLLPLVEVSRRLQPSSRTLVRSMIALVAERMALETAGFVLDHAPTTAASRARLRAALGPENAPALARRLVLVEYVHFGPLVGGKRLGDFIALTHHDRFPLRHPVNFLSALVLNPIATINLYGDFAHDLANLAEARDLGRMAVRSQAFGDYLASHPGMKNLGGKLLLTAAVPAFDKVEENHWKTTDVRAALRARLAD